MTTSLITGASGGLGEAFAWLCAQDGMNLVLVARNTEKLEEIAKAIKEKHRVTVTVLPYDLSKGDAITALMQDLKSKNIHIDVLINNAGFGAYGEFAKTDFKQEKSLLAVNITALTELTKMLLPKMIERKTGCILNVASTASFQPGPLMAVYYASKAYVMNFSLALSEETRGTGVTVTCLCPGPTATGFAAHAGMMKSRLFAKTPVMNADIVAKIGYRALKQGKPLIVAGRLNAFGAFMTRFISRSFAAKLAKKVQSPL